ncbi:HERV-H LTR-associating protein 2 isoform X1 [Bos indicus]|uniref:HERV-H LTR-associating protein 2 isoform X1 n=1 Tax=Bos indicus TaxID=9915 RepID=A0A6P5D4R1_BOSIN|nr:HERV-H LTR-associating protein 2 isoform X1 [Bos taurus]XP_010799432.1 HERV-H LTR-associating protein 2 isoform X1 [Bos taurus]XP_015326744.1 HERV-H LTR-associating protein 2 isoform X1 [Bos taurus]XP_027369193.1 HERV-H LTR-associating protein 2 isoform X1 [Bos indicus x Bos taurus]XP_027369280.1 HERV-H LTR-associating protein 2 isoform X1 [Bos indicus x Bos taurus]XP_027369341.1 HERV-H LTR-associating protein 2 isoform X1 [Bos indicus x Bos taurus]XP_027369362.1 HERV-H LTR-associating pro
MKAQAVLAFFFTLIPSLCGPQDASFSHVSMNEQIVTGRLGEDVILPCSFESGPNVVIHWKNQDTNVYSYYRDSDQLEKQDPRYVNRISLFHGEIHNGNASLSFRRLTLQDEGIYVCYVGTSLGKITKKIVLKVGAFVTPVMKYEKNTTNSFLICNVLSVFPYPIITWKVDNNTSISENNGKEVGSLGPFHINSRVNITGSNSSYQCEIENPLLKQTWTGRWTRKDVLHKMQSENVLLSCKPENSFFPPNQDFTVTWYRVESGSALLLAYFKNSSQETLINQPRLSWKEELINSRDFSLTVKDLHLSDSGEYLCDISSNESTLLTSQTLHVEASPRAPAGIIVPVLVAVVSAVLLLSVAPRAVRSKRCIGFHRERHPPTNQDSSSAGTTEENVMQTEAYSSPPPKNQNKTLLPLILKWLF